MGGNYQDSDDIGDDEDNKRKKKMRFSKNVFTKMIGPTLTSNP